MERRGGGDRTIARRVASVPVLGVVAALVFLGLALVGGPVAAQLPTLPPLLPEDPSSTTTSSTALTLPGQELLTPKPGQPSPTLLPTAPTTAAPPKRVTYKPPPVPGSTPRKPLTTTPVQRAKAPGTTASTAEPTEDGYESDLPFAPGVTGSAAARPTTADAMELGATAVGQDRVRGLAAVAGGLLAVVLLGIVLWIRFEVLNPPEPAAY